MDAAKIIHPGINPSRFVEGTAALFVLALLAISGLWIRGRASSPAQTGGTPTPQECLALKHEVADLKHKLEEMATMNPKNGSESIDDPRAGMAARFDGAVARQQRCASGACEKGPSDAAAAGGIRAKGCEVGECVPGI